MNASDKPTVLTAGEFTDRVMSAIAVLPGPTPTGTFVAALRAGALRDAIAALWVAWHLGTVRTWHVAPRVRARSFALVLAVSAVLATGGLAAAAAVHSVVPQRDDRNPASVPSGSSVDEGPTGNGLVGPEETDETDESPATSDEPDETDDDGGAGPAVDRTDDADGHDGARGGEAVEAEDHDGDNDAADEAEDGDEHDGDDGGEAEDGPGGDDGPGATDDHGDADGGEEPDESEPDGSSGGGDAPSSIDDHSGSSDGAGEPEATSGAEPDD